MKCINCGSETKIIDSRKREVGQIRRRECLVCKTRFSTREVSLREYNNILKLESEIEKIYEKVKEWNI